MSQTEHIKKTFTVIGGDKRNLFAAKALCDCGYDVNVFGFNPEYLGNFCLKKSNTLTEALSHSHHILLPLPCTYDGLTLHTPLYVGTITLKSLLNELSDRHILFAGKASDAFLHVANERAAMVYDYLNREEFAVLNAIPTAEGAIEVAMKNCPYTLNNARCLVLGFGRIAEILAHYLQGLGAKVTCSARKQSDLSWMRAFGYDSFHLSELNEKCEPFNVIFNTIPSVIITEEIIAKLTESQLIIDLASKPGGADVFKQKKNGCDFHHSRKINLCFFLFKQEHKHNMHDKTDCNCNHQVKNNR